MHGIGLSELPDGTSYFGEWKEGENHGFGTFKNKCALYRG
jgi:hypothetical protein